MELLKGMRRAPRTWRVGDRARVSPAYHWAQGAAVTIARPVQEVSPSELPEAFGEESRLVPGRARVHRFYWVVFDEPQWDAEGDGPYQEAEIDSDYLVSPRDSSIRGS